MLDCLPTGAKSGQNRLATEPSRLSVDVPCPVVWSLLDPHWPPGVKPHLTRTSQCAQGVQIERCRIITPVKRRRIHEYLSFRAAVKTDAGTAAAAHTDGSKGADCSSLARNGAKNLYKCLGDYALIQMPG
jgi:hypothetical protein